MALMANTGGTTMTAFTLDTLETNIIKNRRDFLGQTLPAGTYVMLLDLTGLMQANTSGANIFDDNAPYLTIMALDLIWLIYILPLVLYKFS